MNKSKGALALSKLKAEIKEFVLGRWGPWLGVALESARVGPDGLAARYNDARAIAQGEDVEDSNSPRSLVKKWLRGKTPATADSAYLVGAALATKTAHPYASGLFAVLAAGHYGDFLRTIRALGTTTKGARFAAEIIPSLPLLAEADVADAQGWSSFFEHRRLKNGEVFLGPRLPIKTPPTYIFENGVGYIEAIDGARDLVTAMRRRLASAEIEEAWNARHSDLLHYETDALKNYGATLSLAVQNAEAAGARGVPVLLRWEVAGLLMDSWANEVDGRHYQFDFVYPIFRDIIRYSILRSKGAP
ncbi:MAG: hypothetical protein WB681_08165 [Candidatus Cybelea sp.]